MNELLITASSALWLGILTSISPCPLATNVAAVSYLSKKIIHIRFVIWSGLAYTLGRMIAYAILGFLIIGSLLNVPSVAQFLQTQMNKALGPILLLVGLFLLDVLKFKLPGFSISSQKQEKLSQSGVFGSFFLGLLFALSFCPISAALFFGSLIPLSLRSKFGIMLPFFYGFGTGLPVLFFSICIALGIKSFNKWFRRFQKAEFYARKITGVIFILVGVYFCWAYIIVSII